MTVIALANQKGGVMKTSTAVALGHGLALDGYRVLVVDLDPQGHVAVTLGLDKGPGTYQLIYDQKPLPEVVVHARPNLDIVPSDKSTELAKNHVVIRPYREGVLLEALGDYTDDYDFILLDLAPSLDVLHVAALTFSDWVLIPTKLDHLAADGVNEIIRSMAEVSRRGHGFQGFAILPTFFERTTRETTLKLQELVAAFGDKVWPPIPQDTKAREAATYGQTIWEYCPQSPVVVGYTLNDRQIGGYAEVVKRLEAAVQ